MDIFKENSHKYFQNFPKNVITDLYKLCFQNYCASLIKIVMKGGGAKNSPLNSPLSPTFSCNAKKSIFVGQILVKSTTSSTILFENVHKCCPFLF